MRAGIGSAGLARLGSWSVTAGEGYSAEDDGDSGGELRGDRPVVVGSIAALLDPVEPIHQTHAVDSRRILGVVVRPGDEKPSRDIAIVKNTFDIALPLDQATHQRVR